MTVRLSMILFAVVLCLAGVVAYQALAPVSAIDDPVSPANAHRALPAAPLPQFQPPDEEQFAVINARPLFDPSRQPVAEPEQAGVQSTVPPDLTLVGVAIGPHMSVALLKKPDSPAAISAQLGQSIEGWKLVHIEAGFVVFHAGTTDYTVPLRAAAGLSQPALVPPPGVTEQPGQ